MTWYKVQSFVENQGLIQSLTWLELALTNSAIVNKINWNVCILEFYGPELGNSSFYWNTLELSSEQAINFRESK